MRLIRNSCNFVADLFIMEIHNSNNFNALIQDLGPFKMKSANLSIKGKIELEYETYSKPKKIGSQNTYGKNTNYGFLVTTLTASKQY